VNVGAAARKSVKLWVFAGSAPVAGVAYLSSAFAPHPLAPGSLAAIVPALLLSALDGGASDQLRIVIPELAVVLYLLASVPLLVGAEFSWHWCAALFSAIVLASAGFFACFWSSGLEFQGKSHTFFVLALNALCASLVGWGLLRTRGQPASRNLVLCHVALFCWLDYAAFPWLGEMF